MQFFKRDNLKKTFNEISFQAENLVGFATAAIFYGAAMGGPIGGAMGYLIAAIFVCTYCLPHTYALLKTVKNPFKRRP